MRAYQQTLEEGPIDGDSALVCAYGVYLMNGGTPEGFDRLTLDDIQIMLATFLGLRRRELRTMARAFFGGDENG